ncbi:MAG: MBL fold metallo-hydrolase [Bacteroidales bacterium]|nr:MBL fold metallo-hydrolase [Bacteroidales bacterium]
MKLIYIYHSCFVIEGESFTIIIDYYKDTGKNGEAGWLHQYLLKRPGNLYVLVSHAHFDHFNPEIFTWNHNRHDIRYILSGDMARDRKIPGQNDIVFLDKLETYKDDLLSIEAFGSTDIGISFLICVEGKKIFHAGDLNNWHWNEESTQEEVRQAENDYLKELDTLAKVADSLDLVMFPVDPRLGKDYMRGAEQFIHRIRTALFVPMHFDENYEKAAAFGEYAKAHNCKFVGWTHKGETIDF